MSDHDDVADVLAQVVDVGPSLRQVDLGDAVSRHVSNRPSQRGGQPDPETVAALRALANEPAQAVAAAGADGSRLYIEVDFNALFADVGEPEVWTILGKLKDLFGSTP